VENFCLANRSLTGHGQELSSAVSTKWSTAPKQSGPKSGEELPCPFPWRELVLGPHL